MAVAAHCGNADVVKLLLRYGAKISMRDASSSTPLHLAPSRGHIGVMTILLSERARTEDKGPDDRTPLRLSCDNGHFEAAELLLLHQARENARDKSNLTALHAASKRGNADIVGLLIRHGADVEAKDGQFMTALHHASEGGHSAVVELLLEKGANIDIRDAAGDRPLLLATSRGHVEVVRAFLDRHAPIRAKFTAGPSHDDSPLCLAARNGHADVVTLLLSQGASVREKDEFDWPPLRYAAHYGHPDVVERLLMNGASLSGIQSWGFNLTADRISFAKHVDIPEDRKESVMRLLRDAEEREMLIQERQAASSAEPKKYASTAPAQTGASELDHGVDIRPPLLRELFSPDNARYTTKSDNKPLVQLESGNPSSVSDSPRPNGVVPTSISTVSDNGPKQTSYQFTPQQRVSGAISAWPTIDSASSSTGQPSVAMARFSYLTTPPAVDMTPVKIVPALNSEEISSNSNSSNYYQDRRRNAGNSALADRSAGSMTKTSLESMREDHQIDSTMQDHTSLPGQNSSPFATTEDR